MGKKEPESPSFIETPHWNTPEVRGALIAMQGFVCAYCSRKIEDREGGQVDHFRPQNSCRKEGEEHTGYWWLTYDFDNYFLSCSTCNSDRKGARFPTRGNRHASFEDRTDLDDSEPRSLLCPTKDPIDDWLDLKRDDILADVYLVPRVSDIALKGTIEERVRKTCDLFCLNGDSEHLDKRIEMVENYAQIKNDEDVDILRAGACRQEPESYLYYLILKKLAPDKLPSIHKKHEEQQQHLENLAAKVTKYERRLAWSREKNQNEKRLLEYCFALAYIWLDPPVGNAAMVEEWIKEKPWFSLVEKCKNKLAPTTETPTSM